MADVMRQAYRVLSESEKNNLTIVKDAAATLYDFFDMLVPAGREQSIAKTKLEEAVMWAVKGVTG